MSDTHEYTGDPKHCHSCAVRAFVLAELRTRAAERELQTMRAMTRKLQAVSAQFRQAVNEATTADAAETYRECADAVETAIAVKVLVAVCEGCGTEVPVPTTHQSKVYADPPHGWTQCGVSRHRGNGHSPRLAVWCPVCRLKK